MHKVKRPPGRPKGATALTARTRRIAEQAARDGSTPLQVMLTAMKAHLTNGDLVLAVGVAEKAAPYIHPRLQAVAHIAASNNGLENFSLDELSDLRRALQDVEAEHSGGKLIEGTLSADNNEPPADAPPADAPLFD